MSTPSRPLLVIALISLLLSACGTTAPTSFYTLSAQSITQPPLAGNADKIIIGIGPVEVSPYLERNQIVTRTDNTRLKLTELNHWAAPLEDNIANVLAVNLSRLLPETQPISRPWVDARVQYNVLIKVLQFDADQTGNIQLKANWAIQKGDARDITLIRYADIEQPSVGEDYASITTNMGTALAALSEEISTQLSELINATR